MLKSKELRKRAWLSLKGKYWNAFLASFISGLVLAISAYFSQLSLDLSEIIELLEAEQVELDSTMLLGLNIIMGGVVITSIISLIVYAFVDCPFLVGYNGFFIQNTTAKPELKEIFSGFKNSYKSNVKIMFLAFIKTLLWSFLFIIPGIIKMFEYAMIPYILAENSGISTKDAFALTKKMMKGNKFRLFKLNLSFIGWYILSFFTRGVGVLFLLPYVDAAKAEFYQEVKE